MKLSIIYKNHYYLFNFWFTIQLLFSLSWISPYPYAGYLSLFTTIFFLIISKPKWVNSLTVVSIGSLICVYYYLPREYGPPNTYWILNLFNFLIIIFFFNKEKILKALNFFSKTLILLCVLSLVFKIILSFGISLPSFKISEGPQEFVFYFPFFIDRVGVSSSLVDTIIGGYRFHGPFFEPGSLGQALGFMLWVVKKKYLFILTIIFGLASFSMMFLALLILFCVEKSNSLKSIFLIFLFFIFGYIFVSQLDKDSFVYTSSIGRIVGDGDKVLNTRTSIYEQEQIRLFSKYIETIDIELLSGIGWDTPGSGGSYRPWLMGLGLIGLFLWIVSFFKLMSMSKFFKNTFFVQFVRLSSLFLFFYISGSWVVLLILVPIIV